jgi:hypothetical protein
VSREAGRRGRQRTQPSTSSTSDTPLSGRAARPAESRYLLVAAGNLVPTDKLADLPATRRQVGSATACPSGTAGIAPRR